MANVYIYQGSDLRHVPTLFENRGRRGNYDERTQVMHRAFKDAISQYMFNNLVTGDAIGLVDTDRCATVVPQDGQGLRYRVYRTEEVSVQSLLPERLMSDYDWAHAYVPEHAVGFQVDVRVLSRGSIVMSYFDVVRGVDVVDGYGSDFVAMTELIERRIRQETEYRPRLFSGRLFLGYVFRLGNYTRDVAPGWDMLFRVAQLGLPFDVARDGLLSGEMQTYLRPGVPVDYVRSLFSVPV